MQVVSENDLISKKKLIAEVIRERFDPAAFDDGGNERLRMVFDLEAHLAFLGESLRCRIPKLFQEYAIWTNHLLVTTGGDPARFGYCLEAIREEIQRDGEGDWVASACEFLNMALENLTAERPRTKSYLVDDNPLLSLAEEFLAACLALKRNSALTMVHQAVRSGVPVRDVYIHVITPVLHELGRLWHLNRITVGHEHYCTAVAQMAMAQLFPDIFDGAPKKGRMISTCVAGELHEVGARMVSDLFEMHGWDTVFLGSDVPVASVIDTLIEYRAHVLAISVTLGSHLGAVTDLIAAVRSEVACTDVKIMVGGGPFNLDSSLWQRLGADGWAPDGPSAIEVADRWRQNL